MPLPNVADLMGYLLKGMVLFLIYNAVRSAWPESTPARPTQTAINGAQSAPRAQLANPPAKREGESTAMQQLEKINDTINSATDSVVDGLRGFVRKDPSDPDF